MARVAPNPYEVLGVPRTASQDEIRTAYRRLAMKYHPDRNQGDPEAEETFKSVSEAYAVLRDPESRARFDRYGSEPQGRPDFSTVDWQTIFREADLNIEVDVRQGVPRTGNPLFDALFGAVTGMMRSSGLLPGEDREVEIHLPIALARSGGSYRLRVPGPSVCATCRGSGLRGGAPCPTCAGRGAVRGGAVVDVTVPARVRDGAKLRLKGLGGPGNPPGDVLVTLGIELPDGVERRGDDLHTELPVTPLQARRGHDATVVGIPLRIPAHTPDGATLRVAGAGLAGGDLIVTVRHAVWRGLWRSLREILIPDRPAAGDRSKE